jgi:hypothetical protein
MPNPNPNPATNVQPFTPPTSSPAPASGDGPARTHAEAMILLRRPFAPGAIGFRAMTKVAHQGRAYAGAQVAAYLNAQSVTQRLNHVVPGRWTMQFAPVAPELVGEGSRKRYLACRLAITLPVENGGPDVEAVFEDIGEMDSGSFAGLKALYSDARKRAAVAAGIGAYLYTALAPVVLPIGAGDRQVQAISRTGSKPDLLVLSKATEEWLRQGYARRMTSEAVRRGLGEMLGHGEPESGMGQGEAGEATQAGDADSAERQPVAVAQALQAAAPAHTHPSPGQAGNGVVSVDFGGLGPAA